jgi:signal transduction histidine kinase
MRAKIEKINFLGKYLASAHTRDETLEMAMIISQDVLGYDHAMIRLLDGSGVLRAVKWIGFPREAADIEIHLGEGITGQAAKLGRSILVKDTTQDPRFIKGVENCRSELCVPMIFNGETFGVFNVESETAAYFSDEDRHILENFASLVTTALEAARLREELGRSEKLSMIGSFASSILHDIRNDIHQLNICADLLESAPGNIVRVEMAARKIRKSAENIHGLIGDIFEFVNTGQSRLRKEPLALGPFLEAFTTQLMATAPEKLAVNLDVTGDPVVQADQRRLKRALANLANNAAEAMPEGGALAISCGLGEGGVFIEVADTGKGIEPDQLTRIWEPFYTQGKWMGTGLGMAIVRKIVDDHGWIVTVNSEVGKGTRFRIVVKEEGR